MNDYRTSRKDNSKTSNGKWLYKPTRYALYILHNWTCVVCGDTVMNGATLNVDHITPRILGGSHKVHNLTVTCDKCNCSRSDDTYPDFLRRKGYTPDQIVTIVRRINRLRVSLTTIHRALGRKWHKAQKAD